MGFVVRLLLAAVTTMMLAPAALVVPSYAAEGTGGDDQGQSRMLLVLDSSGSMKEQAAGGTKIQAARKALAKVISGLPDEAEVGMRVFGSKVFSRTDPGACNDTELVVPIGTDNRDALSSAATAYKPYGETPIPVALKEAAKDLGSDGARSIVLVSDGESTCGDPCPVAKQVSKSGVDLTINVVGLAVSGKAREQLKCIADNGGGTYYDADSAAEIESTLEHVATRSLRPFTYQGTPIVGGSEQSPTPITAGEWTDTLAGQGAKKSYAYELKDPGTDVRFVFYLQDEHRTSAAMYVKAYAPDGTECDSVSTMSQRTFDVRDVMSAQARIGGLSKDCDEPGTYRFEVYRDNAATSEVPIGLRVLEEPTVDDPGWTTPDLKATAQPAPAAAGAASPLTGGQSFLNAPLVEPGSYSGTIVAGESDLVRVHLDYGQSLKVGIAFPAVTAAMAKALDAGTIWDSQARVVLYDPTWSQLPPASDAKSSDLAGINTSSKPEATALYDATSPVTAAADDSFTSTGGSTSRAGDYFVGVSMASADNSVEYPFTLTIAVEGTAQQGPMFADGGGSASPSASATTSADPGDAAPTPAAKDEGGAPAGLLILLAVVIVAVLGGGSWWWSRRNASVGGPPAP
ncbi:vWA domain-containing protein [Nocardioides sp. Kera G14]|uniref:vWA domain-containing protein n=1 Tax=Nocardioides sp. Kera G14 TaxID=2884264 RepID=UPI001D100C9D|nr:VWA domain-containing protein [Nocardioides sp. Kera G14]UDY23757.1 VWA domain-containing protein [Nocardioides sp. Kera G14]